MQEDTIRKLKEQLHIQEKTIAIRDAMIKTSESQMRQLEFLIELKEGIIKDQRRTIEDLEKNKRRE